MDVVRYLLQLAHIDVSVCAGQESVGASDASSLRVVTGKSAVHIAAIHNSVDIAEMLIKLKSGCPLNVQDAEVGQKFARITIMVLCPFTQGSTALHVAYKKSSLSVCEILCNSPGGSELERIISFHIKRLWQQVGALLF